MAGFSGELGDSLRHTNNLNLDINLDNALAERVDLNETGVDGLVELAELGDKTNITLVNLLVGVGAADAAGDGAEISHDGTEGIDHGAVPVVRVRVLVDDRGIALLQVLSARPFDRHGDRGAEARGAVRSARVRGLPWSRSCQGRHVAVVSVRSHLD